MTDQAMADEIYLEPLTTETIKRIIKKERPDSILAGLGGQTGLTLAMQLDKEGFLQEQGVRLLGTDAKVISRAEDRELFKEAMAEIGQPVIASDIAETVEGALEVADRIGYPVIVRPAFTLGGAGGGAAANEAELRIIAQTGLDASPITQILVERAIFGWKEIEFETMRDGVGNVIAVCSMENFDPVGVHTGDSIVVAPSQTLSDKEYQMLRTAALDAGLDASAAEALTGLLALHGPMGATLTAARAACRCEAQRAALDELQALQNALGEAGRGTQLDLSMADEMEYYNGLVFTGYVAGIPRAVLKGGRYDYLMQRFTPGANAIGFAIYLDELERLAAPLPPVQQQGGEKIWLNIALPKGRLGDKAYKLLAGAGYSATEDYNDTRRLVVENPDACVRYFLVKPSDVAIYVEHGAADIGIVGKDILTESGADVYELLDTGMGKCRMCVAGPATFADDESRALRVATKLSLIHI